METTLGIRRYLENKGKVCLLADEYENDKKSFAGEIDGLLVLGGDGTLIRAAREFARYDVPMLGINLGTLGYLTSVEKDEIWTCMDALMADEFSIEKRIMLSGTVYHQGKEVMSSEAVNDVIVSRSGFSKLVELRLYVNDELCCFIHFSF